MSTNEMNNLDDGALEYTAQSEEEAGIVRKQVSKVRDRQRSAEILGVFAAHNFYANGFTPTELRTTLEDLGPTYVKIGQILSSRTDVLPDEYCAELEKLRSDVAPLDPAIAREVIESETGRSIDDIYVEFRDEPLGSASIAQAHYAVLKDGRRVVTKVQRPKIAGMMRKDFVLLKKLAGFVGTVSETEEGASAIDLVSVIDELEKVTEEELDFRVEAAHTRDFREHCIEDPSVISCPEIIDELTTERILTMTYVDGYSISHGERVDADGYDRNAIGTAIIENYLHQVMDVGTFHGDPHQGNIMVSGGVPYWIDFGMIGHVDERSVNVLQQIVLALVARNAEALADAALALGKASGRVDKSRLVDDVDSLIERYAGVGSLDDLDVGELTDLTAEHRIEMPADYTMLVRSLVTIEGVLEEFCPDLDVFDFLTRKMTERVQRSFDAQAELMDRVESVAAMGAQASKLPGLAYDVLRNLAKGRTKMNFELTGYDKLVDDARHLVTNVVLAIFACVLFAGSCTLCTTGIQPQANGVPLVALIGFVFAVALGLFAVRSLMRER